MAGRFVVDNSVVMAWCFADEASPYADAVLESLGKREAVVPAIWPLEVGNVLAVAERKRRLDKASAARFLELLRQLPIAYEPELPSQMLGDVLELAREQHLSTYDASYLALAMRLGLPLATQDASLAKAAKKVGVPLHSGR
jgi:predicted nucleic acid-binding protein